MRFETKVMAALVVVPVTLTQTPASALPYDPYPWCPQYSGKLGGATNCGFLTRKNHRCRSRLPCDFLAEIRHSIPVP